MKPKLTELGVAKLRPSNKAIWLTDSLLPSFGVRIYPTGKRVWGITRRWHGSKNPTFRKLGEYPAMSLTAARTRAREILVDPDRPPPPEKPVDTVAAVIAQFIARDQKPRNRGWRQAEQTLHKDLAPWLERPIQSITKRDVIERLDAIVDSGRPIHANRVLSYSRRMFAWATERDILEVSPAVGVRPPAREVSRDRVLAPDELAAVWHACTPLRWPWGPIVQLLMLTATRKGEVRWMRWQDIDLEQRLWVVPREFVKANRAHEIPLSDLALEIIADLPRIGSGPLVFPANRASSKNPIAGASYAKTRLDKISGVADWRFHDLRRTAASNMARLNHPPHVVAAVLGHAPASTMGITAVYNRHKYGDEKRLALSAWAHEVERIIGRSEATNVIALR